MYTYLGLKNPRIVLESLRAMGRYSRLIPYLATRKLFFAVKVNCSSRLLFSEEGLLLVQISLQRPRVPTGGSSKHHINGLVSRIVVFVLGDAIYLSRID